MQLDLRYLGRSHVEPRQGGLEMRLSPNLARPAVSFDAELSRPVRFREAVSALHDVVIGDLRWKKRGDKEAYLAWKQQQEREEQELRKAVRQHTEQALTEEESAELERHFKKMHKLYWSARVKWANELMRDDPELFRHLVPCDPVVTVAPDVVFLECFSKDESSYGCLTVDRGAFRGGGGEARLGTTNVDYSIALYDHFQTLRTYRPTRLLVDPTGFEVKVEHAADYREEKIDLPPSWLRGFGELQAAMALPCRKVELPVEAVYSLLAFLKRSREKRGPRSLRFQLTPGRPPAIVIDPWEKVIQSRGPRYEPEPDVPAAWAGSPYRSISQRAAQSGEEEIKIWGRRRLLTLARVLPLAERVEVRLLGSGLPSVWVVHMGEMRFTLALSGWTANDWTSSGSGLSMLAGDMRFDPLTVEVAARLLEERQVATFDALAAATGARSDILLGSLHQLAKQGQVIYDFSQGFYRYRQVMPVPIGDAALGPEPEEIVKGRAIAAAGGVSIVRREVLASGRLLFMAEAGGKACELILDADGRMSKAKCSCSYFFTKGLRAGPCRHLLAVRLHVSAPGAGLVPPAPRRLLSNLN